MTGPWYVGYPCNCGCCAGPVRIFRWVHKSKPGLFPWCQCIYDAFARGLYNKNCGSPLVPITTLRDGFRVTMLTHESFMHASPGLSDSVEYFGLKAAIAYQLGIVNIWNSAKQSQEWARFGPLETEGQPRWPEVTGFEKLDSAIEYVEGLVPGLSINKLRGAVVARWFAGRELIRQTGNDQEDRLRGLLAVVSRPEFAKPLPFRELEVVEEAEPVAAEPDSNF